MKKYRLFILIILLSSLNSFSLAGKINDASILAKLDIALEKLDEQAAKIPDEMRRVSFYAIKVDKDYISRSMFRQIQGKIESKFTEFERPVLVYAPEVQPVKLVVKEDTVQFVTELNTTESIKDIAEQLRLDGLLEGSLCLAGSTVHLNLRIIDAQSMAVVWSQTFDSIEFDQKPKEKTTGADFGFGTAGLYLRDTLSTDVSIPEFAKYYYGNLRLVQRLSQQTRISISLRGTLFYLYDGFRSSKRTMVSTSSGQGAFALGTYFGVRLPMIPVKNIEPGKRKRDWLASELRVGRIWGPKAFQSNVYGFQLECDVTGNLSVALGISYTSTETIAYSSGKEVKAGGLLYEISLLQFNYKP